MITALEVLVMEPISDGLVNGDIMREALAVVGQMDAGDAVVWLRQTEDTLGVNIARAADNVVARLQEQHNLVLTAVQKGVLVRAVVTTAVASVTALRSGHYSMWRELVRGTSLSVFDPLLSIRRRIAVSGPPTGSSKAKSQRRATGKVPNPEGAILNANKLGFVACSPATDAGDPTIRLVLLTTAAPSGACRHEALYLQDGECLLKGLVDGLSRIGSKLAAAAWPVVCGPDPNFDGLGPINPNDGLDDGKGDGGVPS
jgi:hypothetical protein